jgi:ATP-dependent Lon protease
MTDKEDSTLTTVDLLFLDGKTVFPYESASLKAIGGLREKSNSVGLLYRRVNLGGDFQNDEPISNYEPIGTLMKVINRSSEMMLTGGSININQRISVIGIARFELVRLIAGKKDEAIIRVLKDEISKEEEELLKKSNKIDLLKEKALYLLQSNDKGYSSSELSKRNFIYNEDNLVRLCFLLALQLKLNYEDSLGFLKLNSVTDRVDFLLKLVEQIKVKEIVFDQNFTFDVTNHSDLLRIEKMVQSMKMPDVVKKAIKAEINKLKKSP